MNILKLIGIVIAEYRTYMKETQSLAQHTKPLTHILDTVENLFADTAAHATVREIDWRLIEVRLRFKSNVYMKICYYITSYNQSSKIREITFHHWIETFVIALR